MDSSGSEASMKATAGTWINSLALARLVSSVLGGNLADKMNTIIELLIALAWTVYFIAEAGVKLILPSHLFHKVTFNKAKYID